MSTQNLATIPDTNTTSALLALKISRGFFMGGKVAADKPACSCGGKWKKIQLRKEEFIVCDTCDEEPSLFRVRRYLPGLNGRRGKTVDIRYDQNNQRLRSREAAIAMMKHIDGLLSSGKYEAGDFMVRDSRDLTNIETFIKRMYLPFYEKKMESGSYKEASLDAKKQYYRNYILPYFTGYKEVTSSELRMSEEGFAERVTITKKVPVDWASPLTSIRDIHDGTIEKMLVDLPCSKRLRETIVLEELKCMMGFAYRHRKIHRMPFFPKMNKAKLKDPETFLNEEQQQKVLGLVWCDKYRTMLAIMCITAIRPCEVRTIKWSDWDFKNGKLWIRRHAGKRGKVHSGRKSKDEPHAIAISKELMSLISWMARPINQDEWMFPGEVNSFVSQHPLSRAWAKAVAEAGLPHVDSYRGSKSSCMSNWLNKGYSVSEISAFTGLSEEDVRRYAQRNQKSVHELQIRMMEG